MSLPCTFGVERSDGKIQWSWVRHDGDRAGSQLAAWWSHTSRLEPLLKLGGLAAVPFTLEEAEPVHDEELSGIVDDEDAYLNAARKLDVAYAFLFDGEEWRELSTGLVFSA